MAKTKAEIEDDASNYDTILARTADFIDEGLYTLAIKTAMEAWPFVDGMVKYAKRYQGNEVNRIEAVDVVLDNAPFLLDFKTLSQVAEFAEQIRRGRSELYSRITKRIESAGQLIWSLRSMWDQIERHAEIHETDLYRLLGGDRKLWQSGIDAWCKMGIVARNQGKSGTTVSFVTRMGQIIDAKCPKCGHIEQAPKAMFLEPVTCSECRVNVSFVLCNPQQRGKN